MDSKVCPQCNNENNPIFTSCWKCGKDFAGRERKANSNINEELTVSPLPITDLFELMRSGRLIVQCLQVSPPIILREKESIVCVLECVDLFESRAVSHRHGVYGGPTIRVAKGLSFRLGKSFSKSESHQEMRKIEEGKLIITTQRLMFSAPMKTMQTDLKKIIQIEPFDDGIGLQKEGKEKKQYFVWLPLKVAFRRGESNYGGLFNGELFQTMVFGAMNANKKSLSECELIKSELFNLSSKEKVMSSLSRIIFLVVAVIVFFALVLGRMTKSGNDNLAVESQFASKDLSPIVVSQQEEPNFISMNGQVVPNPKKQRV